MNNQVLQSVSIKHHLMHTLPNSVSSCSIPCLNPKNFNFYYTTLNNLQIHPKSPPFHRSLISKCRKTPEERDTNGGSLKDSLSGLVGKQVEELLSREENKGLLDGLERASMRVEMARKELAEIERQELEEKTLRDYVNQLENRASEIAECQQEILEARAMVDEAERSLSLTTQETLDGDLNGNFSNGNSIDKDRERFESVKAALVASVIGTLAEVPISLSQVSSVDQLILPLGITFVSCALFGVTFRYTIRRDLDNLQLKTGTSAAFGFVKGLATLSAGPPLELSTESFVTHAFDGAMFVSGSLLIFAFASVGLDLCFKMRFLSPFPMKTSDSDSKINVSK